MDVIAGTFSSSDKRIIWYENLDGLGNFGEAHDISNGISNLLTSLEVADLDGDNDLDILFNTISDFGWIENVDGLGNYGVIHLFPPLYGGYHKRSFPVDLDNDGDMDILSWQFSGGGQIIWLENIDGAGNFSDTNLIFTLVGGSDVKILTAADMDMDGDMDVVVGSDNSDEYLIWIENTDGNGDFGNATTIIEGVGIPRAISLGDFDNDNDIDVAFTSFYQDRIGWIENIDGQGNFGPKIILSDDSLEPTSVTISDIDGDGDNDIIAATRLESKIIWFENSFILSLLENNNLNFSVYPNPTNDLITLKSETKINNIKIYSSLGQLLISNVNKNSIDISGLKSGIYFLNATDSKGSQGTVQIIKK